MKQELSVQELHDELMDCAAIEVDDSFVIYTPAIDISGEISFFEESNQVEPYIVVTDDWDIWKEDGVYHVHGKGDFDHDYKIVRLAPKDQSDYVVGGGETCPSKGCDSKNLEAVSEIDHCGNRVYQECRCVDCGYEFTDIYELKEFSEVQDEENH